MLETDLDLSSMSLQLEEWPAPEVVAWAADRFGEDLVLAASFQDCVLIDIATAVAPGMEVVFMDTGAHFPETLEYVEEVRRRYRLNLTVLRPSPQADDWPCGSQRCCELRKVEPLTAHLAGRRAWMSGLRRVETPERAAAPVLGWDGARDVVKVNPLAAWSDADVAAYAAEHRLPAHPLTALGYHSIGCAPTTAPVAEGQHRRAGRWAGTGKTECGLHL